jgi:hypothetical protein
MQRVEQIVDDYLKCWSARIGPGTHISLWENNDFGCEHLQIFRSGFNIVDFSHDEISQLAALLSRELRAQINHDHYLFWAFCAFLTIQFEHDVALFSDPNWRRSFLDLTNLILSSWAVPPRDYAFDKWNIQRSQFVNYHLIEACMNKWSISNPLVFAVLEGLLRRKNRKYMDEKGEVITPFNVLDSDGSTKQYNRNRRVNRLDDSLRCFEQKTVPKRGRTCPYLTQFQNEFTRLYPSGNVYDTIDDWRNDYMHGNKYWRSRSPILVNLICMLTIDEIEPVLYDSRRDSLRQIIQANTELLMRGSRASWLIFPPDV